MPAEVIDIADAVVTAINAHSFSAPYDAFLEAQRLYVPVYKLTDLDELKVTVAAAAAVGVLASRAKTREMGYEIDVGFQKKLQAPVDSQETQGDVNDLMALVEEVADFLFAMNNLSGLAAAPIAIANDPIYDPKRLDEFAEFLSVLTVTYRVYR